MYLLLFADAERLAVFDIEWLSGVSDNRPVATVTTVLAGGIHFRLFGEFRSRSGKAQALTTTATAHFFLLTALLLCLKTKNVNAILSGNRCGSRNSSCSDQRSGFEVPHPTAIPLRWGSGTAPLCST